MTNYFDVAVQAARRAQHLGLSYAVVTLPIGSACFSRCHADVFTVDTLTITSMDDETVIKTYQPGQWKDATVFDTDGYPLTHHTPETPPDNPIQCVPCPVCPQFAWLRATGPEGIREYCCSEGHQMFITPPGGSR